VRPQELLPWPIPENSLGTDWAVGRHKPLPFETSIPGIFAVGDLRHGSMKRVAAAVGEGASAVASTHTALAAELMRAGGKDR
jgi:thioredoxin reductase (NADPH)